MSTKVYTHHEHGRGDPKCEYPFDVQVMMEPCHCASGNVSSSPDCPCIPCYKTRRAECPHTRTHTDAYGYTECTDCGADHNSPVNPLTKWVSALQTATR